MLRVETNFPESMDSHSAESPRSVSTTMRKTIIDMRNRQNFCADCFSSDPEWTSTTLGIFICVACCGIHRHLGTHISRVKSIKLDEWTPSLVSEMSKGSNHASNSFYLEHLPRAFKYIDQSDPVYLREAIIMDKYLRKLYVNSCDWIPFKVGTAQKRGKYKNKWAKRFFRLINSDLVYYKSQNNIQEELGRIQVDKVWISDGKTGKLYTLQVIGVDGRSVFMGFEDAREMLEWLNILRLSKAKSINLTLQTEDQEEYEKELAASLIVEGNLEYSNRLDEPKSRSLSTIMRGDRWQKSFASLTYDKLYLYKSPLDAYPTEIIPISEVEIRRNSDTEFMILMPDTIHYFKSENLAIERWMHAFLKTK